MKEPTGHEIVAAAVLTAAFVSGQRQALNSGRADEGIREKFVEYLQFVQEQSASTKSGKKKK